MRVFRLVTEILLITVALAAPSLAQTPKSALTPLKRYGGQESTQRDEALGVKIEQMIAARDFDGLNKLEENLAAQREAMQSFYPFQQDFHEFVAYYLFKDLTLESEKVPVAWLEHSPNSRAAIVAYAQFYVNLGWSARGNGWASTVPKEKWDLFHECLGKAEKVLKDAEVRGLKSAPLYAVWITVGMGEGYDKGSILELLKKGLACDPCYQQLVSNAYLPMLPRWNGQPNDAESAARLAAEYAPELGTLYYYALVAVNIQDGCLRSSRVHGQPYDATIFSHYRFNWELLKKSFEAWRLIDAPDGVEINRATYYCLFACQKGDRETAARIFKMLSKRPNYGPPGGFGNASLRQAWKDWVDGKGEPPSFAVHAAVHDHDVDAIKKAIAQNPGGVDSPDYSGMSPLAMSLQNENYESAIALLQNGADPNQTLLDGCRPVHYAGKSPELIQACIDAGGNVNAPSTNKSMRPLHESAGRAERIEATKVLLSAPNIDLNAKTTQGFTPLMYAVNLCAGDNYKLLIAHGADVNAQSNSLSTALHYAAQNGNIDACRALIAAGARTDIQDNAKRLPIERARRKNQEAVVKYLESLK